MARNIHCEICKTKLEKSAHQFGELYEYIEGTALFDMFCDGGCFNEEGPKSIMKGDKCYASVLLPNKHHPAYEIQKPSMWAHKYINYDLEN